MSVKRIYVPIFDDWIDGWIEIEVIDDA